MNYSPNTIYELPTITTFFDAVLCRVAIGGSTPATAAYPSSNLATYYPIVLNKAVLVKKLFAANGSSAANNIDMGIYDQSGTRLVSIGSTARSGTNTLQIFDITDTTIGPGLFYLAISQNGTTGQYFRAVPSLERMRHQGIFQEASAFPLPATASFATPTFNYMALIGLSTVDTI